MPARTFEDSAGTTWEVFEVQRSSHKAQAVTAGLERGWLAFISSDQKRRLAPFPPDWRTVDDAELERLCATARAARPTTVAIGSGPAEAGGRDTAARTPVPRIRPPRAAPDIGDLPIASSATSADAVEDTVREFAHQARARGLPAIEAMVRLKALLTRVYTEARSPARDLHSVRRWFVDAYYFERNAESVQDAPDQSR